VNDKCPNCGAALYSDAERRACPLCGLKNAGDPDALAWRSSPSSPVSPGHLSAGLRKD
jgi:predicted amidophosphoribosyltransferase